MKLVAVLFKGARHKTTPKFCGGVLNPDKKFYVYRTEGNQNPQDTIINMRNKLQEQHNVQQHA